MKFMKEINKMFALLSGFLILIISLLISYEVFVRYLLHSPTFWTHDISRYLLLAISLLGAAFTFQEDGHIKVELLTKRFSKKINKINSIMICWVSSFFFAIVLWKTIELFLKSIKLNWKTVGTFMIPSSVLYAIIIMGVFLLMMAMVIKSIEEMTKPHSPD